MCVFGKYRVFETVEEEEKWRFCDVFFLVILGGFERFIGDFLEVHGGGGDV